MKYRVWMGILAAFVASAGLAQQLPIPTISVTPTSGQGSVVPTVTWNSTGATACQATGGWSGVKATSGSQVLPAAVTNTVYSIQCSSATGEATLSWIAPTARTDNTPLTNLAGYRIYSGATATNTTQIAQVLVPNLSRVITGLAPGLTYFQMTAYDSANIESAKTNAVSKNVVGLTSPVASATLTIQSLPNPPGTVTILAAVFEFQTIKNQLRFVKVGVTTQGVACAREVTQPFWEIAPENFVPNQNYKGGVAIGICLEGPS